MEMDPTPVRANVEVQVVYSIVGAALSALELSPTSNSGSSSNSSPQISPHTTISISSPNLSDQRLPIEASHALAGNASARARPRLPFLPRAQAMKGLKESIAHNITLQQLMKSEKGHQRDASKYKKRERRLSKEMYMIVSTYALLQGVLFVAVAQSSATFTCEDWWGPAGIAGGVTIGTLFSVVDKLLGMDRCKREAKRSERCQSAVYDKLELLYSYGSGCPIDVNLEPQTSRDLLSSPALLCLRGLLVLGFLVGFSLLMIASCTSMLCHSKSH